MMIIINFVGEKPKIPVFFRFFSGSLGTVFFPVFVQAQSPFPPPWPTPCCKLSGTLFCTPHQHCIKTTGFNTVLIRFYTGFCHVPNLRFLQTGETPVLATNVAALPGPVFFRVLLKVEAPGSLKKTEKKNWKNVFSPTKPIFILVLHSSARATIFLPRSRGSKIMALNGT